MSLLTIIFVLIIIGVILWLVNRYIPMAGSIKTILNVTVVVLTILWLLKAVGLFTTLGAIKV